MRARAMRRGAEPRSDATTGMRRFSTAALVFQRGRDADGRLRELTAQGPDVAWNRTTLCAWHHHRGVHKGSLAIRGRAPDELVYTLGVGRFGSGDVLLGK